MLFVYHGGWPVVSLERELFPEGGKRSGREIQGKTRNALWGGTERAQERNDNILRKIHTIRSQPAQYDKKEVASIKQPPLE